MTRVHQYTMLCASIISQDAAIEALENGESQKVEMRDAYRLRRNFIVKSFNDMGLTCHLPRGSFYAFPNIESTGLSSKEFAVQLLEQQNVACVPGTAFGAAGEGFLRCCFAASMEQIEQAVERMAIFVARLKG